MSKLTPLELALLNNKAGPGGVVSATVSASASVWVIASRIWLLLGGIAMLGSHFAHSF